MPVVTYMFCLLKVKYHLDLFTISETVNKCVRKKTLRINDYVILVKV